MRQKLFVQWIAQAAQRLIEVTRQSEPILEALGIFVWEWLHVAFVLMETDVYKGNDVQLWC